MNNIPVLKDFRVPGWIWLLGLLALGMLVQKNDLYLQSHYGIQEWEIVGVLTLIGALIKGLNVANEPLSIAVDIIYQLIDQLKSKSALPTDQVRGPLSVMPTPALRTDDIPAKPNKIVRWMIG